MKIISTAALALILSGVQFACKGADGPQGPAGPQGALLTGNISGFAALIGEGGYNIANRSGVVVNADGTAISDTTDSTGHWILQNMKTGIYTLNFTKDGYGPMRFLSIQFVGGGDLFLSIAALAEMPSFSVSTLNVADSNNAVWISGSVSTISDRIRFAWVYFGKDSTVSSDPSTHLFQQGFGMDPGRDQFVSYVSHGDLWGAGFHAGETIYMTAYAINPSASSYTDPATNRQVYTALSTIRKSTSVVLH